MLTAFCISTYQQILAGVDVFVLARNTDTSSRHTNAGLSGRPFLTARGLLALFQRGEYVRTLLKGWTLIAAYVE